MITVIQRVTYANVVIDNEVVGQIDAGIVALVAVEKVDTQKDAERLLERIYLYILLFILPNSILLTL